MQRLSASVRIWRVYNREIPTGSIQAVVGSAKYPPADALPKFANKVRTNSEDYEDLRVVIITAISSYDLMGKT